ncbi:hypothetical protein LCGC14_1289460 [marine sediment metagenome]|uniref:Lipoprotein n=2 Tax=root TaxID=1 RepID=A0A831QK45_9FLAO|nr:hypothetical protein [Pricia sp.]HEA20139.1 hypothetical protein [Pricia antarctica]
MKRISIFLCAILVAILSISCSLDDDRTNFEYTTLETLSASLPDTFDLGRVYTIDVKLLRPDECTFAETFDVRRDFNDTLNIRTVAAIGIKLDQEDCAIANDSVQDAFQFEVLYTKPYVFKFYSGEDASGEAKFLEIEVPVRDNHQP